MKNLLFISLGLVFISFFVGCKKDNDNPSSKPGQLKGKLYQLNTTTPIPNAEVYLVQSVWEGGLLSGSAFTVVLDTTTTNDKGEYSFDYKYRFDAEYYLTSQADQYFKGEKWYPGKATADNFNIFLTPFAWIKLKITNVPPVNNNDYLLVGGFTEDSYVQSGKKVDTIIIKKVLGNRKNFIYTYENDKDNMIKINKQDSVYCKGLDTTFYEIKY